MTSRYFIELSYLGTNYHGWQAQKEKKTIQSVLNDALKTILREEIHTVGCSRTDAGVHAKQYFAHFDAKKENLNLSKLTYSLNCLLPYDIAIHRIIKVKQDVHARFDVISRTYEYHIHTQKNPFLTNLSYYFRKGAFLDIELMNKGCEVLYKYEDFTSFCKTGAQTENFLCKIIYARWSQPSDGRLLFTITADRFLRNMVRAIVGTMLLIGKGKMSIDEMKKIIESKKCGSAGVSVPACGLYLAKVEYEEVKIASAAL